MTDDRTDSIGGVSIPGLSPTVFFSVSIAGAFGLLMVANYVFGTVAAIKGSYALIGLLLGTALYHTRRGPAVDRPMPDRNQLYGKCVYLLVLGAVFATVALNNRVVPLVVALPAGYLLLVVQLRAAASSRWLLPQVIALFTVSPVTKYLSTGFYFGGGDTFTHVRFVDLLVESGTVSGMEIYEYFPGMHATVGALVMMTGLGSYDALQLFGIVTYAIVVAVVYLLARITMTKDRDAIYLAAAVALIEPIIHFTSYFFPQSLAAAFLLFLTYLAYRLNTDLPSLHRRLMIVCVVIATGAVLIHHLTFVLFLPVIVLLIAWNLLSERVSGLTRANPFTFPLAIAYAIALTYWTYHEQFVSDFIGYVSQMIQGELFAGEEGAPMETTVLGGQLAESTPTSAAWSVLSPEGLYFIGLLAIFAVGLAAVLEKPTRYRRRFALLTIGIASAFIVFRTPLAHPDIERLRHPLSFFFAMILGTGVFTMLRSRFPPSTTILAIVVILLVGTAAPLVGLAGDDLYDFNEGEDLYEIHDAPDPQSDFSDAEWRQLTTTSQFVERHDITASTFTTEESAMEGFGVTGSASATVEDDELRAPTPALLYRAKWSEHRLMYAAPGPIERGTVVIEPEWLAQTEAMENKVYTTGGVSVLTTTEETDDEYRFGP